MSWTIRIFAWATLAITIATPARSLEYNCIRACQVKVDVCAESVLDEAPLGASDSQIVCARSLFVDCFVGCIDTGTVVHDDYEIVLPRPGDATAPRRQLSGN